MNNFHFLFTFIDFYIVNVFIYIEEHEVKTWTCYYYHSKVNIPSVKTSVKISLTPT